MQTRYEVRAGVGCLPVGVGFAYRRDEFHATAGGMVRVGG